MRKMPCRDGTSSIQRTCMRTGTGTGTEGEWNLHGNNANRWTDSSPRMHAPPALTFMTIPRTVCGFGIS